MTIDHKCLELKVTNGGMFSAVLAHDEIRDVHFDSDRYKFFIFPHTDQVWVLFRAVLMYVFLH